MTGAARLAALVRLAAMRKEADLMAVARASAERGRITARIDALDSAAMAARQAPATDIASLAAQEGFGRLVAAQRVGLDGQLAEKTEAWRLRRDAAALSFGRCEALETLRDRLAGQSALRRARRGYDSPGCD